MTDSHLEEATHLIFKYSVHPPSLPLGSMTYKASLPPFWSPNSIVSEEWSCTLHRRLPGRLQIDFDYGLVSWRMTERELRIEMFPEVPWDRVMSGDIPQLIPHFARQFLVSVPQIAAPDISFHWEIAVNQPNRSGGFGIGSALVACPMGTKYPT